MFPVAGQYMQPIAREGRQLVDAIRGIEQVKNANRAVAIKPREPPGFPSAVNPPRFRVLVPLDHLETIQHKAFNAMRLMIFV